MKTLQDAVKMNLIDRAIAVFSPSAGVRRMRARATMALAGSWLGGATNRRQTAGWTTAGGNDADTDTLGDLPKLRERSRDLVRNAPLATGAINTTAQSVVGTGLALQSRPDANALRMTPEQASEFAKQVEREFRLWCDSPDCDITRTQNFYGLQDLAFRSACENGDVFALLPMVEGRFSPYSLKVQLIEADRVETPTSSRDGVRGKDGTLISGGVELDRAGAPIAYHIRNVHPGSMEGMSDKSSTRYQAFGELTGRRNVVHLLDRKRVGQTRSVPMLSPVVESLKLLDKYRDAELMAAVVAACFTVFVHSPTGEGVANGLTSQVSGGVTADDSLAGQNKSGEQVMMGPAAMIDLADGREVTFANPNRPNTTFDLFVQAVARQIGVAIGLPFEVLMKHFTASYSAARAALLEAWRFYNNRRAWLAAMFCQPIFEAWMDEAVATGQISAPGYFTDPAMRRAYQRTEWVGDAPGSIDPEKEIRAAQARIDARLATRAEECMALTGGVFEDKVPQMAKEERMLKEAGLSTGGSAPQQAATPGQQQQPDNQGGNDLEKPEDN